MGQPGPGRRDAGSGAVALAVLLLLLCCLPMSWWADWILSEGNFTPLALLNLATAFLLIVKQRVRYALLLVVAAALMLFVRPDCDRYRFHFPVCGA
jgi:hypothetical protein